VTVGGAGVDAPLLPPDCPLEEPDVAEVVVEPEVPDEVVGVGLLVLEVLAVEEAD
jgi:hypothetical protein